MRRKLLMGLCLAVLVSFAAGDYLFNRSRGGQEPPKNAEPEQKKDELFDILKKSLEAKSGQSAMPPLPVPPPNKELPPPVAPKDDGFKREIAPLDMPKDKAGEPVKPVIAPIPPAPPTAYGIPPVNPKPSVVDAKTNEELLEAIKRPATEPKPALHQSPPPAVSPAPATPVVSPPQEGRYDQTGYPKQAFDPPTDPANLPKGPDVKPAGTDNPAPGSWSLLPQPVTIVPPKLRTSPWRLNVEVVESQTVVTATVNKKHEFKIVCQSLDLQTGTNSFKASGKVQISGDAMTGHCERLTISLSDDRLVLEGAAELSIQKTATTVSSDDGKPAAFELKGETLNLRISELQSGKFLQAGWLKADVDPTVGHTVSRVPTIDEKAWSPYGTLRRSKTANGSAWRLENAAGQPILHLLTSGDRVLEQYEGRTISVIGAAVDKMTVRVTHIAVP